jgi:hypothetical protein
MKKRMTLYRWRKKLLLPLAALPMFQMGTTCISQDIATAVGSQLALGTFQLIVGAINSTLLQSFPDMDVLQILLGGNRQPFFQQ